jgi:hypothetical protein
MNLIKHVCASVLLPYIAGIRDAKGELFGIAMDRR